jgi:hypothetical protein
MGSLYQLDRKATELLLTGKDVQVKVDARLVFLSNTFNLACLTRI